MLPQIVFPNQYGKTINVDWGQLVTEIDQIYFFKCVKPEDLEDVANGA